VLNLIGHLLGERQEAHSPGASVLVYCVASGSHVASLCICQAGLEGQTKASQEGMQREPQKKRPSPRPAW
jgi:hypothetical protein